MRILRGKRDGAFDPDQYYLEAAVRARAARKVRHLLRRNVPVVLTTTRWASTQRFLDDVAVDLMVGRPAVHARTLSLAPLRGRKTHEAWGWMVQALTEFLEIYLEGPVWQAVNRHGFRHVVGEMLARSQKGSRRALLMHGVEHLPVEVRDDLLEAFTAYREKAGDRQRFDLLLATAVDGPSFEMPDAVRVALCDFGDEEGLEALVEYVGPTDAKRLALATRLCGGVPALIDALGAEAERHGALPATNAALSRLVEPVVEEMRSAVSIADTDSSLARRLEQLVVFGPQPCEPSVDGPLSLAGLVRTELRGHKTVCVARTPLLGELVGGA
jgi:hypothetical protein